MKIKDVSFLKLRKLFMDKLSKKPISDTEKSNAVYHEVDFTLKNPIIYSKDGNILVRSRYTSSRPPIARYENKISRMKKTKSWGFDQHNKIEEGEKSKVGKSHQDLRQNSKKSLFSSFSNTPVCSRKSKGKLSKSTSHGFFRSKKSSQQSMECYPQDSEDYMFLDFTKNAKLRSRRNGMQICSKTSTL